MVGEINISVHQAHGMSPRVDGNDGPDKEKCRILFREQFSRDGTFTTLTVFMDMEQLRSVRDRANLLLED